MFRAIDSGESPQPGRILAGSFTPPIVVDPLGDGGGGAVTLAGNAVGPLSANRVVALSGDTVTKLIVQDSGTTIKMLQGGDLAAPVTENPYVIQPRDPTYGAFSVAQVVPNFFNGTNDTTFTWGYNVDATIAGVPVIRTTFETDFNSPPGTHSIEMHFGQFSIPNAGVWAPGIAGVVRPLSCNAFGNGQVNVASEINSAAGAFRISEHTTAQELFTLTGTGTGSHQTVGAGFAEKWCNTGANNVTLSLWSTGFAALQGAWLFDPAGTIELVAFAGNKLLLTTIGGGNVEVGAPFVLTGQTTSATIGAAGGAAALPAQPLGYLTTSINGTPVKIPYYNP